ncbi:hypothetical protein ACH518_04630 [Methylomonas sp. HW2-6]|uniref:hypothetical protein n=1 Tax=Methylomonas sp. HW2-6 TaxID=3376687 RepID=UPI00404309A6
MTDIIKADPIAKSYEELQSVELLRLAIENSPIDRPSAESCVRVLLMSVEIALINLDHLASEIKRDFDNENILRAEIRSQWFHSFHRILVHLGMTSWELATLQVFNFEDFVDSPKFQNSTALKNYCNSLQDMDLAVDRCVQRTNINLGDILSCQWVNEPLGRILHFLRLSAQDCRIWEHHCSSIRIPLTNIEYDEYVARPTLFDAVNRVSLNRDTFLEQFRAAHQIPELLIYEVNNLLEVAIKFLREHIWESSVLNLRLATTLLAETLPCLETINDCLQTTDYYAIRNNLGLTSGSHSVAIHYHLFRDLYPTWCETVKSELKFKKADDNIQKLIWLETGRLQVLIHTWRKMHMHFPRNYLGSHNTKSLIGTKDALLTVQTFAQKAYANDTLLSMNSGLNQTSIALIATQYLDSQNSMDTLLLEATGKIAQSNFPDVQKRSGYFANFVNFDPPKERNI